MTIRLGKTELIVELRRSDGWTKVPDGFSTTGYYVQPSVWKQRQLRKVVMKEMPIGHGSEETTFKIRAIKLLRQIAKDATGYPTSLLYAKQLCESWGY